MTELPLVTPRLRIDRLTSADAPALAAYRNEASVARYQGWSLPYGVERAAALVAADARDEPGAPGCSVNLAVRCDGGLVGDVYLAAEPDGTVAVCEVGVTFAPAAQGRGLATEAVGALLDAVLVPAGRFVTALAYVDGRNAPSRRLFERLGFVPGPSPVGGELRFALAADVWRRRRAAGRPHTVDAPVVVDEEQH